MQKIFKVKVFSGFSVGVPTYKLAATDDVAARQVAIKKWIPATNAYQDDSRRRDKQSDDLSDDADFYRHVTAADVDYCEIEMVVELD